PSAEITFSVTGPRSSNPLVLTFAAGVPDACSFGFFSPGVPPHPTAANTSATVRAASEILLIAVLPHRLRAARERRLEPVAIGAIHGTAEVHDSASFVDRDRRREQHRR